MLSKKYNDPSFLSDLKAADWPKESFTQSLISRLSGNHEVPLQTSLESLCVGANPRSALGELWFRLGDQGVRGVRPGDEMAIPFLGRLLPLTDHMPSITEGLLQLLVIIAIDQGDCCLGKDGIRWSGIWNEQLYNLVAAEACRFLPYMAHSREAIRLEACHALAWFPCQAADSLSLMKSLIESGSEDEAVTAIIALGLLGQPVKPILDKTARLRFASVTAYCHIHSITEPYFETFSEIAQRLRVTCLDPDFRNEPYHFGIPDFAVEIIKRQESEVMEELLSKDDDESLGKLRRPTQPWD